jgi:hypothetical protein
MPRFKVIERRRIKAEKAAKRAEKEKIKVNN